MCTCRDLIGHTVQSVHFALFVGLDTQGHQCTSVCKILSLGGGALGMDVSHVHMYMYMYVPFSMDQDFLYLHVLGVAFVIHNRHQCNM